MKENTSNYISIEEEFSDYIKMIKALSINYLNIYLVSPETNRARVIKLNGYITEGMLDVDKDFDYLSFLKKYANGRVYKDDVYYFIDNLKPENVISTFSDGKEQNEFSYRVIEGDEIHYYSAHYIRISRLGEPLKLVAGFRNIDQIVSLRAKEFDRGMSKAYAALANIYYSMHRIDLKKGTFTEIKTNERIKQYQLKGTNDFEENAKNIFNKLVYPSFLESVLDFVNLETLEERMKGKNSISIEFVGVFSGWVRGSFIKEDCDENGKLSHVLWTLYIINESKKKELELRYLAEIDQLSGILNRGTGEKMIKKIIEKGGSGSFFLMDVDSFKSINDDYGHEAGDYVIKELGRTLKECSIDTQDVVMRLGGDEFGIYVPDIRNEEEAVKFWENLTVLFSKINLKDDTNKKICLSAGCVIFDGNAKENFNTIYKKADEAMYKSKAIDGFKLTIDK